MVTLIQQEVILLNYRKGKKQSCPTLIIYCTKFTSLLCVTMNCKEKNKNETVEGG